MAAQAQLDSLPPAAAEAVLLPLEDAALAAEWGESTDLTDLTDDLAARLRQPLDLNRAGVTELARLPGVGPVRAQALLDHVALTGPLQSVYELQVVPGFDSLLVERLRPFVLIAGDPVALPGQVSSASGAPWQDGNWEALLRAGGTLQRARGFDPPAGSATRYTGDRLATFGRLRYRAGQRFSAGLTWQQDAGEPWQWQPSNTWFGADYVSVHAYIQDWGRIRQLALGDYQLQLGQGLLFSRGLGWLRGASPVLGAQQLPLGILPHVGANEAVFLRGAAVDIALHPRWSVLVFGSRIGRDASRSAAADSALLPDESGFRSLQLAGLHRTPTELAARRSVQETLAGARVAYRNGGLLLAATQAYLGYDRSRQPGPEPYRRLDFRGERDYLASLEGSWAVRNLSLFAEAARSNDPAGGRYAATAGIQALVAANAETALVARWFEPGFNSPRGFAQAQRPTAVNNEQGVYLATTWCPVRRWTLHAWADLYRFPWYRYRVSAPSAGSEWMLQADYAPRRDLRLYLRLRQTDGERDPAAEQRLGQLADPVPVQRTSARFDAAWQAAEGLRLHSRVEWSRFTQSGQPAETGLLLLQDVRWHPHRRWALTARMAVFSIDDYDARIYAYEPDVYAAWSIPALQGSGFRALLLAQCDLLPGLSLWLRLAHTHRSDTQFIGSGLDQLPGNERTDVRLQLGYRW